MFLLRAAPCYDCGELPKFDKELRRSLSKTTNCNLTDTAWIQACLPVRFGGLGISSAQNLAASAYLASMHATEVLTSRVLPHHLHALQSSFTIEGLNSWRSQLSDLTSAPTALTSQKSWSEPLYRSKFDTLLQGADTEGCARLLAVSSYPSGTWINALPSTALGLRLGNDEARIAVGLRVGAELVHPHQCICGSAVKTIGYHGLSCRQSKGTGQTIPSHRNQRHHSQSLTICRNTICFRTTWTPKWRQQEARWSHSDFVVSWSSLAVEFYLH